MSERSDETSQSCVASFQRLHDVLTCTSRLRDLRSSLEELLDFANSIFKVELVSDCRPDFVGYAV